MEQYLIQHAIRNVWGNPYQDLQFPFGGKRLTPVNGALNVFQLGRRLVTLPTQGKRYHVYQIGQLYPGLIGFANKMPAWVQESWKNLADLMGSNKMMISLYTKEGVSLPRFTSYLMFSNERDLVYAVEVNDKIKIDFNQDQIYLRVYSNAYFEGATGADDIIACKGKRISNSSDVIAMQGEVTQMRQRLGYTFTYVNGHLTDDISPFNAGVGDLVEYVFDGSVKRVVTFTVGNLNSFESILDGKRKYLLHYAGTGDNTIDYQDDIDTFILAPQQFNKFKGYYYHHNTTESIRMVTHRDYSVVTDYVEYISQKLASSLSDTPMDLLAFKIQLVVRKSGTNHALIFDNSRIFEMYKLDDDEIVQAMVGLNSTLPIWRAENLENNDYTKIMRTPLAQSITLDLVQGAYGYNSISKIVGDTPQKTTLISGRQTATIPQALVGNCTVYEYDANGLMLGWYPYTGPALYQSVNNATRLIEVISGKGTDTPKLIFGQDHLTLPTYDSYRVYRCFLVNGEPNNDWQDITGSTEYTVQNGVLIWGSEQFDHFLMIRSDETFLAYDIELPCVNGNLFFTLAEKEDRGLGTGLQEYLLPVPMGDLDLILNQRSTIKGLDYNIDSTKKVMFCNKKYLVQPGETAVQKIHVRATGFCTSDLKWDQLEDVGFIKYGYLSNNNRYDLRDDKVLRITVDGKTMDRSDLVFSEEHDGVTVADPTNGLPYQIKDIVVPLKQMVNEDTYTMRAKSQAIDVAVSNYMTIKEPEPDRGNLNIIIQKYRLVSTFVCRILDAIRSGEITQAQVEAATSDSAIIMLCHPFEDTLAFDPVNEALNYDYHYVQVEPHHNETVIDLQLWQYKFLSKVVSLYCHGVVKLSPFFTVST